MRWVWRAGERVGSVTFCPGPVRGGNGHFTRDLAALVFTGARHQSGKPCLHARRFVRHRVGLHHQWLRVRACAVDNAPPHLARDGLTIWAARHRHLQKLKATRAGNCAGFVAYSGASAVVALPGAGQHHITQRNLLRRERVHATAVWHVVPQQAAGFAHIDWLVDDERRDVAHLAVGILGQLNVLNDAVAAVFGIELAKGAARDLFISNGGCRAARWHRHGNGLVNDDARDTGLCRWTQGERQGQRQGNRKCQATGNAGLPKSKGIHVCLRVLAHCTPAASSRKQPLGPLATPAVAA